MKGMLGANFFLTVFMSTTTVVHGGWWNVTNSWSNTYNGFFCVEPPPFNAVCGWAMRITSDTPVEINAYNGVLVPLDTEGKEFQIKNQPWNVADPSTANPYCTDIQLNAMSTPKDITVEWDCICVRDTCDPVASPMPTNSSPAATTSTSIESLTLQASSEPSTGTAAPHSTIISAVTREVIYEKQFGKCHVVQGLTYPAKIHLQCFRDCLTPASCHGVNVKSDVKGLICDYVTQTLEACQLEDTSPNSCNFWQKLYVKKKSGDI